MLLNKTKLAFVVYNYKNVMKKDGGISALPILCIYKVMFVLYV